jgi:hypothetical protein
MKWFFKIFIKIIISQLPIPYSFWKKFGFFKHGKMDSCEYAIKIFNLHFKRAYPNNFPKNITLLELGPGDSIASAIIGFSYGVSKTILVDVGNFATKDIKFYKKLVMKLKIMGLKAPNISEFSSLEDLLKITNTSYLSNGLSSLKSISSNSIDLIWSHSVLEHIQKKDFIPIQRELKRILKSSGFASHNIDFQDHLNHSLNNLRFSEDLWESKIFLNAGFYTNRIPAKLMHSIFKEVGFSIKDESFGKWPKLPIKRKNIHRDFHHFNDEELINRTSNVLLKL